MTVQNITAVEAYKLMKIIQNSVLIDVRTEKEWKEGGVVTLDHEFVKILLLSWRLLPDMVLNQSFIKEISAKILDNSANLFFMCRSGVRSFEAANFVLQHGYLNCYNISDGFESNQNDYGWKNNNLPWRML